jgi:hypothetical protein
MRTLTTLVILFFATALHAEDTVDTSKLEGQARAMAKAFLDGDFGKIADATHPKIIESMGGKEKMLGQVEKLMKTLKDQGFSFKKYTVGKAEKPVLDEKRAYVVIPTSLEMKTPDATVVTNSYLLAISEDKGKTWTFADGAGLSNPTQRKLFFPDLPEALKLPEPKEPKVTKD